MHNPTHEELMQCLSVLDRLDGSKLLTSHEEIALNVVSDALVALTTSVEELQEELREGKIVMDRMAVRVKVWYEKTSE